MLCFLTRAMVVLTFQGELRDVCGNFGVPLTRDSIGNYWVGLRLLNALRSTDQLVLLQNANCNPCEKHREAYTKIQGESREGKVRNEKNEENGWI